MIHVVNMRLGCRIKQFTLLFLSYLNSDGWTDICAICRMTRRRGARKSGSTGTRHLASLKAKQRSHMKMIRLLILPSAGLIVSSHFLGFQLATLFWVGFCNKKINVRIETHLIIILYITVVWMKVYHSPHSLVSFLFIIASAKHLWLLCNFNFRQRIPGSDVKGSNCWTQGSSRWIHARKRLLLLTVVL